MIVPYGHERSVRSLPWATVAIFALSVAVFLATTGPMERSQKEAMRLFVELRDLYLGNPHLELDPATQARVLRTAGVDENQREVYLETLREQAASRDRRADAAQQAELDALVARFWEVYRGSVAYRFGVVPDRLSGLSLIT